ncbi:hypothetical protein A4X03_0g7596, partial [Tilletia caries]
SILLAAVKELVTTPRGGGPASRLAAQSTSVHSPLKKAQQERMARVQERVAITSATTGDPHEEEVGSYLRNVFPWRDTEDSAQQWWKVNETEFPTLAKLARIDLSAPGSTADVELVFATAGWMMSSRRGRINGETLGWLVTTHGWMRQGLNRLIGLDQAARATGAPILEKMDAAIAK